MGVGIDGSRRRCATEKKEGPEIGEGEEEREVNQGLNRALGCEGSTGLEEPPVGDSPFGTSESRGCETSFVFLPVSSGCLTGLHRVVNSPSRSWSPVERTGDYPKNRVEAQGEPRLGYTRKSVTVSRKGRKFLHENVKVSK